MGGHTGPPLRKMNGLIVPLFAAVAALRFLPCSPKGNGIHKGGNLGVHPCAPARRQRRFRLLRKQPSHVSRETKSALLWNKSVSRETSPFCMWNIDRQRDPIIVLLLIHSCPDSRVHHHANRPIKRIQEKTHVLNQPQHCPCAAAPPTPDAFSAPADSRCTPPTG